MARFFVWFLPFCLMSELFKECHLEFLGVLSLFLFKLVFMKDVYTKGESSAAVGLSFTSCEIQ